MPSLSVLPQRSTGSYGFFGYEGTMVDTAIATDNAAALAECIDNGWINHQSSTIGEMKMIRYAQSKNAVDCEALLRARGWTA